MKFSFSTFSSNIFKYLRDITKTVILSIYFLLDLLFALFFFFFSYLENLIFSFLLKNPTNSSYSANSFVFFLNSRYFQINSFYLNFLDYIKLDKLGKATSDILIFVALYSFFSIYFFTGSASVAFSNEGLWLSVLSLAVIYFFFYLHSLDNAGKDAISIEIESLKKLMLKNSELSTEVSALEDSTIAFQSEVINILESWFFLLEVFVNQADTDLKFTNAQIESLVDVIFSDHLRDLSNLTLARENLTKVISLKDFTEETISEIFENN